MGSLTFKILVGYWMAGAVISILLTYKKTDILEQSSTVPVFVGRVLLFLLVMMLFWPVVDLILLSDELSDKYRKAKKVFRSIYDHHRYSRTSDAAKVRRLLKVYREFKRYRPQAREEK